MLRSTDLYRDPESACIVTVMEGSIERATASVEFNRSILDVRGSQKWISNRSYASRLIDTLHTRTLSELEGVTFPAMTRHLIQG